MSSLEFTIKREMEDSFSHTAVKLENNDLADSIGLYDDGSLFMDPDMEFKAEPEIEFKAEPDIEFKAEPDIEFKAESEIFESSKDDMKYSFDCDVPVCEEDLPISKSEVDNEENVKTGVKKNCSIQSRSIRKEEKGKRRGMGKECLQNEEQIENSGCEKPLCQESDSKTHTDVGTREKSFGGGNYGKQFSGVVNPNTQMLTHTKGQFRCRECGKTFSKRGDLEAHYETRTRRSFKCSDCGKGFFRKVLLLEHLGTHTGKNPFECNVCNRAFSRRSSLTLHYRIHTKGGRGSCDAVTNNLGMSDDDDVLSSTGSFGDDECSLPGVDDVTTQLAVPGGWSGPVGVAAATAIASAKNRRRPLCFELNPSIRKRQQKRLLKKLKKTIDEYATRVGEQAVVVVATPSNSGNNFECFGAKPLEDVMNMLMTELENAVAQPKTPG